MNLTKLFLKKALENRKTITFSIESKKYMANYIETKSRYQLIKDFNHLESNLVSVISLEVFSLLEANKVDFMIGDVKYIFDFDMNWIKVK